jgi:hypothetical protein
MGSIPIVGLEERGLLIRDCRLEDLQSQIHNLQYTGGYPSGQRGLTVNQLAKAFGGSNPSPPTWLIRWQIKYICQRVAMYAKALIAQSVEHILGKNGVMGSNPIEGSRDQGQPSLSFLRNLQGEGIYGQTKV